MTTRPVKAFASYAAIILFVLTASLHLHLSPGSSGCESLNAANASSGPCSVCTFKTNVAIAAPEISVEHPEQRSESVLAAPATFDSVSLEVSSSRAPPRDLA